MSEDRPTPDTMSIEEATISNMWEIVTALKVSVAELVNEHAHRDDAPFNAERSRSVTKRLHRLVHSIEDEVING